MNSSTRIRGGNRGRDGVGTRWSPQIQQCDAGVGAPGAEAAIAGLLRLRSHRADDEESPSHFRKRRIETFAPKRFHGSFSSSSVQEIVARFGEREKELLDSMGLRGLRYLKRGLHHRDTWCFG